MWQPWDDAGSDRSNDWVFTSAIEDTPEELFGLWDGPVERSRAHLNEAMGNGRTVLTGVAVHQSQRTFSNHPARSATTTSRFLARQARDIALAVGITRPSADFACCHHWHALPIAHTGSPLPDGSGLAWAPDAWALTAVNLRPNCLVDIPVNPVRTDATQDVVTSKHL